MNIISHDLKVIRKSGNIRGRIEITGELNAHTGKERSFGNLVREQASIVKWLTQHDFSEEQANKAIEDILIQVRNDQDNAGPEDELEASPEVSARFDGLVDLVEDDDGEVAFLIRNPDGSLWTTTETSEFIAPSRDALPWRLPRDAEVRGYYVHDSIVDLYNDLIAYHVWASKLDDHYYILLALHDILTYVQEKVQSYPQIELASADPERGKSRTGQAMSHVSYRGIITETLNEANLFRWADSLHATIFFDVRDPWTKAMKRGSDDILLGRFDRHGAKVARILDPQLPPLAGGTRYFSLYGPTIFAVNEAMPDPMASRCIPIVPPQAGGRWPDLTPEHGLPYRERLVAFAARIYADELPDVPKPLNGRLGDILHSLARVAKLIGANVYEDFLKSAHQVNQDRQSERSSSEQARVIEYLVLASIAEGLVIQGPSLVGGDVKTKTILDLFNKELPERRQLSPEQMGRKLYALGFPAGSRIGSDRTRTVDAKKLQELANKYNVITPEKPGEPGEPGGKQADTGSNSPPGEEPPTEPGGNLAEPQEDSLTPEYDHSAPGAPGAPGLTPPMEEEKQGGFELEIEEPWNRYLEERDANRSPAN